MKEASCAGALAPTQNESTNWDVHYTERESLHCIESPIHVLCMSCLAFKSPNFYETTALAKVLEVSFPMKVGESRFVGNLHYAFICESLVDVLFEWH